MNKIYIDKKNILEYIEDTLSTFKLGEYKVNNARYHHNTSYKHAPSITKNGILSLKNINDLGIEKYSKERLHLMLMEMMVYHFRYLI